MVQCTWPNEGVVKLNVDGSSQGNPGLVEFGGLWRGHDGKWIVDFQGAIEITENLLAELMAV